MFLPNISPVVFCPKISPQRSVKLLEFILRRIIKYKDIHSLTQFKSTCVQAYIHKNKKLNETMI